jgi:hypothetical protein
MPVDERAVKSIFLIAIEKATPAEREVYLEAACAGDESLRRRIAELLEAHAESGAFPNFAALAAAERATPGEQAETLPPEPALDRPAFDFLAPPREPGHLGRLGHYEIHALIGQGGMGVVFKAFDETLDRIVAVKVLAPQYASNATARRRFVREAKAIAAVVHEHVVTIHAVEETGLIPFLVMQCIHGKSLQDRLEQTGPLEVKEILRIGMQTARGLAAAHAQGIVHRDVKPANILLENGVERVKISDFGLARAVDDASITQSGVIAGTPMYMSPEQANSQPVDPRSDLFSLGSVLYALGAGHPPFRADSTPAVLMRVVADSPRPLREINADIPDWLAAIIARLHAKKPEDRFQSAKELADLLEQHLAHLQQPTRVPMPAPVTVAREEALAGKREKLFEATDRTRRILQHVLLLCGFGLMVAAFSSFFTLTEAPRSGPVLGILLSIVAAFIAAAWVKQRWEVVYKGHRIRFQNSCFTGEALFIDGLCVARAGQQPWGELRAVIATEEGAGDEIIVLAETGLLSVHCRIFTERNVRPQGDGTATMEMLPSPWRRLAWVGLGYLLFPVVMLTLFLPGYTDGKTVPRDVWSIFGSRYAEGGWWSTPWIEFFSAASFLILAAWQLWRRIQPRWLSVVSLLLAGFSLAFAVYLWPFGTSRHFYRLVREGRYEEASEMMIYPSRPWVEENGVLTIRDRRGAVAGLTAGFLPLQSHDIHFGAFAAQSPRGAFRFTLTSQHHDRRKWVIGVTAYRGTLAYDSIMVYHDANNNVPQIIHPKD